VRQAEGLDLSLRPLIGLALRPDWKASESQDVSTQAEGLKGKAGNDFRSNMFNSHGVEGAVVSRPGRAGVATRP
jgi:hypothetical protein